MNFIGQAGAGSSVVLSRYSMLLPLELTVSSVLCFSFYNAGRGDFGTVRTSSKARACSSAGMLAS